MFWTKSQCVYVMHIAVTRGQLARLDQQTLAGDGALQVVHVVAFLLAMHAADRGAFGAAQKTSVDGCSISGAVSIEKCVALLHNVGGPAQTVGMDEISIRVDQQATPHMVFLHTATETA